MYVTSLFYVCNDKDIHCAELVPGTDYRVWLIFRIDSFFPPYKPKIFVYYSCYIIRFYTLLLISLRIVLTQCLHLFQDDYDEEEEDDDEEAGHDEL